MEYLVLLMLPVCVVLPASAFLVTASPYCPTLWCLYVKIWKMRCKRPFVERTLILTRWAEWLNVTRVPRDVWVVGGKGKGRLLIWQLIVHSTTTLLLHSSFHCVFGHGVIILYNTSGVTNQTHSTVWKYKVDYVTRKSAPTPTNCVAGILQTELKVQTAQTMFIFSRSSRVKQWKTDMRRCALEFYGRN